MKKVTCTITGNEIIFLTEGEEEKRFYSKEDAFMELTTLRRGKKIGMDDHNRIWTQIGDNQKVPFFNEQKRIGFGYGFTITITLVRFGNTGLLFISKEFQ